MSVEPVTVHTRLESTPLVDMETGSLTRIWAKEDMTVHEDKSETYMEPMGTPKSKTNSEFSIG